MVRNIKKEVFRMKISVLNRRIAAIFIFAAVFGSLCAQAAFADDYSKEDLQEMYMEFLKSEGYSPTIDRDGDVVYKSEGRTYCIIVDENDLEFFRIIFPNFWEIESTNERTQVMVAANYANSKSKVAKVYATSDNVWASIEIFLPSPDQFKIVFRRCMSALQNGISQFVNQMRGQ